jgi:hypothetical protein
MVRQQKQQNALLAQKQQQIDLQRSEFEAEQAAAARKAQIQRDAAAGKPEAVAELAGIDFNAWRGLNTDAQAKIAAGYDAMGQAGLFVASLPPEQRSGAWDQQVDLLAQRFPDVAQYRGKYSDQSLQSVIGQAGQFDKFWQMTKPQEFNVGPGEGRYRQTANGIETVIAPNTQGAPAFSPVPQAQPQGRAQPVAKQVGGATYYQNPETGKWYDNPQEAMGGGGSNATGSFPRP